MNPAKVENNEYDIKMNFDIQKLLNNFNIDQQIKTQN